MIKIYNIEVDCANCANQMEEEAKKVKGVKSASVSFMALKMEIEFYEGANEEVVLKEIRKRCKRIEDECEIFL